VELLLGEPVYVDRLLAKGVKHVQATQGFKEEVFDDDDAKYMIQQI